MRKRTLNKLITDEKGQALIMVLILLLLGGLILPPLLSHVGTGLKGGKEVYEERMELFYAADSGIEDALWQIKNEKLTSLFGVYDPYDYGNPYPYPDPLVVNDKNVYPITIENVWVPDMDEPEDADEARQLIGAGKLIITGNVPAELTHQIKIYYYYDESDGDLQINKIGIWIPPGFNYDVTGECTLETHLDYSREITPYCGGEAVVWTLLDTVLFTDLPGVDTMDFPWASTITFKYTSTQPDRNPEAISWITTSGVSDIPYTWDADVKVYHITSQAGGEDGTTVEAYAIKSELRELGSAISGDYRAIGATLMIDENPWSSPPIRDTLLSDSDATVNDIPDNAYVEAAHLYWSAWLKEASGDIIFEDYCSNFNNWLNGSRWQIYTWGNDRFRGRGNGSDGDRTLTMNPGVVLLAEYYDSGETIEISWEQDESGRLEPGDFLYFAFSGDGGSTWSEDIVAFSNDNPDSPFSYPIPNDYLTDNFRMRFFLDFSSSDEYAYIDNITIKVVPETIADTSAIFKVNGTQVYFAEDADGYLTVPTVDDEEIIASEWSVLENQTNEYSYACYLDVTELVRLGLETTTPDTTNGNGTYTVGDVYGETGNQWSYAAWSLIIIYSSPETERHQLYLYPDFVYVDNNETLEYPISGFIAPEEIKDEEYAARLTCFVGEGDEDYEGDKIKVNGDSLSNAQSPWYNVWNSASPGLEEDGIDIDTFTIEYPTIEPGDTSAQVEMPTDLDSWNLVYIILSFRSTVTTGGTISYLVGG